jgi:hypothetical protein
MSTMRLFVVIVLRYCLEQSQVQLGSENCLLKEQMVEEEAVELSVAQSRSLFS